MLTEANAGAPALPLTYRWLVLRRFRYALSPGWLLLHLVAIAMVVAMVLLGRWQLDVSNAKHFSLQNFGYALQWWAFSLFVLGMWARIMLDTRRRSTDPPPGEYGRPHPSQDAEPSTRSDEVVAYRRYVMPQNAVAPAPATDPERAAYNDYLARLDAESSGRTRAEGTAP